MEEGLLMPAPKVLLLLCTKRKTAVGDVRRNCKSSQKELVRS